VGRQLVGTTNRGIFALTVGGTVCGRDLLYEERITVGIPYVIGLL